MSLASLFKEAGLQGRGLFISFQADLRPTREFDKEGCAAQA